MLESLPQEINFVQGNLGPTLDYSTRKDKEGNGTVTLNNNLYHNLSQTDSHYVAGALSESSYDFIPALSDRDMQIMYGIIAVSVGVANIGFGAYVMGSAIVPILGPTAPYISSASWTAAAVTASKSIMPIYNGLRVANNGYNLYLVPGLNQIPNGEWTLPKQNISMPGGIHIPRAP